MNIELNSALISMLAFAILSNIPLGYLRMGTEKFSVRWFVYIHLSVPFIIGLRISNHISWQVIPFSIASGCCRADGRQSSLSPEKRVRKPRRPKMKQAALAGDLVERLLKGFGLDERLQQYRALIIWEEVVGPQIAARTRPIRIREGILEVNVDQPTWMQQLQLMKPKILAQLNAELGKATIKDLFLKRGKVHVRADKQAEPPPIWRMVQLDEGEKSHIDGLLTGIEDTELRNEMEKFLTKQMRLLKAEGEKLTTDD